MRKNYKLPVLAIIMLFAAAFIMGFIPPALAQDKVQVMVNNQLVAFPDQQPFINQDNRTLVPVRAPMEAAGAKVDWEGVSQTVVVSKDGIAAVFVIGSNQYKVNGESKTMDTRAQIVNDRTCFPIRFVAEALGMQVVWDANSRTVNITNTATSTTFIKPTIDLQAEEPKQTAESSQKPMTTLTPEAKARLMAYPYPVDGNGKQYEVRHAMGSYEELSKKYNTDPIGQIMEVIGQNGVLKPNQKFITDIDLRFSTMGPNGQRIRGILQTNNSNGTLTEQDVEYGFFYGTYFVKPGEPTVPSHWFSEYDTVQLSAPIKIK